MPSVRTEKAKYSTSRRFDNAPNVDSSLEEMVRQGVGKAREKLIDLSLRNTMLNFRHSETSTKHVRLVDERPEFLAEGIASGASFDLAPLPAIDITPPDEGTDEFRSAFKNAKLVDTEWLASEDASRATGKRRRFRDKTAERALRDRIRVGLGMPQWQAPTDAKAWARENGIDPSYDLPDFEEEAADRHTDDKLQTLFLAESLEAKLTSIHSAAKTLQEDAGISALFSTIGFLEWYETGDAQTPGYAPLILLPVNMEKRVVGGEYVFSISGRDDDEVSNVALREKLRRHHALELPEYDPEGGIRSYLELVGQLVSQKKRWRIRRWATIGLFSFSRQAMWNDLDPDRWPADGRPQNHPLLQQIYGDEPAGPAEGLASVHDVDRPEIEAKAPSIITDADASQLSAVIDVAEGRNVVIQGPPGTGKSQAITNIIANAIGQGQSVLFVSEKMAALNVVKDRLDDMELGLYCLEVHSAKASKTQVLRALRARMEAPHPRLSADEADRARHHLIEARRKLTEYAGLMNEPAGATGLTAHDIFWGHFVRNTFPESVPEVARGFRLADPLAIDRFKLNQLKSIGTALDKHAAEMGEAARPAAQAWRGIGNANLTGFDRSQAVECVSRWADVLTAILRDLEVLAHSSGWTGVSLLRDAAQAVACISMIPTPLDGVDEQLLKPASEAHMRQALSEWARNARDAKSLKADIESICSAQALASAMDCVDEILAQAQTFGVIDGDLDKLERAAISAEADAASTASRASIIARLINGIGQQANQKIDVKTELVAASVLLLVRDLPAEKARLRSTALSEETAIDDIQVAQSLATEAMSAFVSSGMSDAASMTLANSLPSAPLLRECAGVLAGAGVFGRLFGDDWRRAKKQWRLIFPEERKIAPKLAAKRLKALALWKEKQSALEASVGAKTAAGRHWNGLQTPFDALKEVALWMRAVLQATRSPEEYARNLRQLLLNGSVDDLAEIVELSDKAAESDLSSHVKTCAKAGTSLTALGFEKTERANALARLRDAITSLGLHEGNSIGSLRDAATALARARDCRTKMDDGRANLLLAACNGSEIERAERINATIAYVTAVEVSGLQPVVAQWLLAVGCPQRTAALKDLGQRLSNLIDKERIERESVDSLLHLRPEEWCGGDFETAPIDRLVAKARSALAAPDDLEKQAQLLSIEDEARAVGLGELIDAWVESGAGYDSVTWMVETAFYHSAAEKLIRDNPVLARHSGKSHEQVRTRFRELDKEIMVLNRKVLAASMHQNHIPPGRRAQSTMDYTDYELLQHQSGLQRPRIALRRLFSRAGDAIRALTPCVMMSPISVAQYLEAGRHTFDLLVVDEASQMRPEDALGAMLRCSQAVIVGDPEQLPPSNFFLAGEAQVEDDAEDAPEESILELGRRCWRPMRMLDTHYRSRHQSLISYSNHEFYDDRLLVYPSPVLSDPEYGVSCRQIDGAYEAGQGRNLPEAMAIVSEAAAMMRQRTDRSIGIVAVNQVQSDLIERLMDELAAGDPSVQAYLAKWDGQLEDFFVKNLENVQGDERDVILISTVYGRTAEGVFHQNFGPINKAYGHRRLNVLFTRAKQKLTLFTSLKHAEIIADGKQRGVRVLKEFLEYASRGSFQPGRQTSQEPDSDFERWFLARLKSAGYEAHPQVGVAKYRIDIGVVHPDRPGSYILGVECDGATYHSSKSARDRDRLRQEVLERLKWTIHRVWSTDWYRNPEREFSRLVEHIEGLRAA